MKRLTAIALTAGAVIFCAAAAVAVVDQGAAEFVMDGGSRGAVDFPHKRHQEVLEGDCSTCHDLFPMERGVIEKMKAEKTLKKKQVMNDHCVKCHRDRKKAGQSYGPISCSKCHQK